MCGLICMVHNRYSSNAKMLITKIPKILHSRYPYEITVLLSYDDAFSLVMFEDRCPYELHLIRGYYKQEQRKITTGPVSDHQRSLVPLFDCIV
uniref:Uncharacterized protein n=1 Tax=Anguilla anguilla TaxID=7936 RepID=A0A0E9WVJ1_ANGAN